MKLTVSDIPYSHIHVIYVLLSCAVGFNLRNVHNIFLRKWPLVVFNISVSSHNFKPTFSNKADAFYSNICFIDNVIFVEDACGVEFQLAYFLHGMLNHTR